MSITDYEALKSLYGFRQHRRSFLEPPSDGYSLDRRALLAVAEWLEVMGMDSITNTTLRKIAHSQPDPQADPIKELTPEDRDGYEACAAYNAHLFDYAKKVYVTSRESYTTQRMQWNAAAAAAKKGNRS